MIRLFALAACFVSAWSTVASAQDASASDEAPEVVVEAAADTERVTAEALYDQAFAALASGDRPLAARYLQQLTLEYPDHALVTKVRPLLESLATLPLPPASSPMSAELLDVVPTAEARTEGDEAPTTTARAELIFFQTLHGAAFGFEVCATLECRDTQAQVGSMMLGGTLGFGASYFLSRDGVSPGFARALNDGVLWGVAHGIDIFIGADLARGGSSDVHLANTLALTQLGGMGVAAVLHQALQPTTGQVSLTSSGGIWASVITGEVIGIVEPESANNSLGWLFMATGDLGLVGGGLLASQQPMTASRVLMIDAGGLLGSLIGLGLGVVAAPEDQFGDPDGRTIFSLGLVGTLSGLASAYYLSDTWDDGNDDHAANSPQLAIAPSRGGATMTVSGQW